MKKFFRQKSQQTKTPVNPNAQKVLIKSIEYPAKIILAWAKAIEGNRDLRAWLANNGYEELTMAAYAIELNDEARNWLLNNGYPHLMAMINAAEGIEKAQKWLQMHRFETLYHMAMAVENEHASWQWLGKNGTPDMFILTQSIKKVKDKIEEQHNDIHTFRRDL
jgi:hypothetical protein